MIESLDASTSVFAKEVHSVLRALWPASTQQPDASGGMERDGLYFAPEHVCTVEITVSPRKDKAVHDLEKLAGRVLQLRRDYSERSVIGYWVVRESPNQAQIEVWEDVLRRFKLEKRDLHVKTLRELQRRLVDAPQYLNLRMEAPFGSISDPETGHFHDRTEYVAIDIVRPLDGSAWSINSIAKALLSGSRMVLLGDYGAGKSMTIRELFRKLRVPALKDESSRFPVCLNLKDHHGQARPSEALQRHGEDLGIDGSALVRAWRAGMLTVLLDGFDELGTGRAIGSPSKIRDARRDTVRLVNNFFAAMPAESGILVAGRSFYFDDGDERAAALGHPATAITLTLNEFTETQVREFLKRKGVSQSIPDWLPSRPLLLGYLASRGMLRDASEHGAVVPAMAWDLLLDAICRREAQQQGGLDGFQIRELLDRLASRTRGLPDNGGPVTPELIWDVFESIHGRQPDERDLVQINRLPGLGVIPPELGGRSASSGGRFFVDYDLLDAARAGDILRLVTEGPPFLDRAKLEQSGWVQEMGELGISAVDIKLVERGSKRVGALQHVLASLSRGGHSSYVKLDILRVLSESGAGPTGDLVISGVEIADLELADDSLDLSRVVFQACYFDRLAFVGLHAARVPKFSNCLIEVFEENCVADREMDGIFAGCDIARHISGGRTVDAMQDLALPPPVIVLMTILKKLFRQRGRGRKENAFRRGLKAGSVRYVSPLLSVLSSEAIARPLVTNGETVWLPNRSTRSRIETLLADPKDSQDPLVLRARDMA